MKQQSLVSFGNAIKALRKKRDLTMEEVCNCLSIKFSVRSLRRLEAGQQCPERDKLKKIIIEGIAEHDLSEVDRILRLANKRGLTEQEKLELTAIAVPQLVLWGPDDNKPAGIYIGSYTFGSFIAWTTLKRDIEERLLPQAVRAIPLGSTTQLFDLHEKEGFRIRIKDTAGREIGRVWFGRDPEKDWKWDGLVRIGKAPTDYDAIVWQIYQRYSDGSYRMIKAQDLPDASRADKDGSKEPIK